MKTVFDVQQFLKRYGIFIYTGDRTGDLDLMEIELAALYRSKVIPLHDYQVAIRILRSDKHVKN
ncbi:YqgQ family protein [Virgibacillus sp. W0430]|uniref:YqgQ family protein n=1 Tax=Virgibacillus sp. W0430 TaxID=3391580 RepID=UPI003F46D59B